MDAEGIAPAKIYYDRFGVKFPALVDPNYALGFPVIPHTIFVDEWGVVVEPKAKTNWKELIKPEEPVRAVPDEVRAKFQKPGTRLDPAAVARLAERLKTDAGDLAAATALASRYLDLKLRAEAKAALEGAIAKHDAKKVALAGGEPARLLGQAYFQLARACEGDREAQVRHATMSFYLHPTIGFGKQISRIIAPEKFDGRPAGDFDNDFREGTLKRLQAEREAWLNAK